MATCTKRVKITDFLKTLDADDDKNTSSRSDSDHPTAEADLTDDQPSEVGKSSEPLKKKTKYEATFQQKWTSQYKWLSLNEKGGMICSLCKNVAKQTRVQQKKGAQT